MKILLDTQCWLWWFAAPERLNGSARDLIAEGGNEILLSAASCWEMAIKAAIGKLELPEPIDQYVTSRLASQGMSVLPVQAEHALHVAQLPHHHRDPFDRLLISQAQVEGLPILTSDRQFEAYKLELIPAN